MLKGVSLQKITSYNFTRKNNSIKEYHIQLLTRFQRMMDYNNKLTIYQFVFVQDIKASKYHINNTRSSSIHYFINRFQSLRELNTTIMKSIGDNLHS
jgi:hypothetical protein